MAFRGKKATAQMSSSLASVKEIEHDAFYDCDELDNDLCPCRRESYGKSYAFAECDKLKKITFAGVPDKLSRHTFDDCDQLHDIIVPAGSSKNFPQSPSLHRRRYRLPVLEKPADNATTAPLPHRTEEGKQEEDREAGCSKRQESREEKQNKKQRRKTDKKAAKQEKKEQRQARKKQEQG